MLGFESLAGGYEGLEVCGVSGKVGEQMKRRGGGGEPGMGQGEGQTLLELLVGVREILEFFVFFGCHARGGEKQEVLRAMRWSGGVWGRDGPLVKIYIKNIVNFWDS